MSNAKAEQRVQEAFTTDYIQIPRKLAVWFGLNESIVLQQIISWCKFNKAHRSEKHLKMGEYWTYNSYPEWQEYFPFWSVDTIKRTITKLEKSGFIASCQMNKNNWTREKWYRPIYQNICKALDHDENNVSGLPDRSGQNAPIGICDISADADRSNPHGYRSGQNALIVEGKMHRSSIDNFSTPKSEPPVEKSLTNPIAPLEALESGEDDRTEEPVEPPELFMNLGNGNPSPSHLSPQEMIAEAKRKMAEWKESRKKQDSTAGQQPLSTVELSMPKQDDVSPVAEPPRTLPEYNRDWSSYKPLPSVDDDYGNDSVDALVPGQYGWIDGEWREVTEEDLYG